MKKLILVFAICMAFAVKSFAYSNYYNAVISLKEPGQISETICSNCVFVSYSMGCDLPGYVVIEAHDGSNSYVDYVTLEVYRKWGQWETSLLDLHVTIVVSSGYAGSSSPGNGINLTWATN